ncbi:MAG: hypothetical protein R2699_12770 [Acidimicrobiales bacterium]
MATDEGLPTLAARIRSSTTPRLTVFTAQSKKHFYCRDAICEFVFDHDAVPLNPFRAFGYFLGDRVDRDLVREANNNLLRLCDELWVFGTTIANGVLFEILYAHEMGMPVRLYNVATRANEIPPVPVELLRFVPELYVRGVSRAELRDLVAGGGGTTGPSPAGSTRLDRRALRQASPARASAMAAAASTTAPP